MKRLSILLAGIVAGLSSCTTTLKTSSTLGGSTTLNTAAVADLECRPRITYTMKPSKAMQRGGLANVKRCVEAEALEKNGGGDLLVNPEYVIAQKCGLFRSRITSISVSGRPANYVNVRSLPDSVWCNPVFRGVAGTKRTGVKSRRAVASRKEPAADTSFKTWTWMLRLGVGSNKFAGDLFEESDAKVGYSVGIELNRAIGRKGAYWGMDLTFASRRHSLPYGTMYDVWGYRGEDSYEDEQSSQTIHWSPIILGWKINLGKSHFAIDPHVGFYWGGDYLYDGEIDKNVDTGIKAGIGIWYKKRFSLDFTYQRGFVDAYDFPYYRTSSSSRTSNCMARLGFAF